jgi:hypothetical protein
MRSCPYGRQHRRCRWGCREGLKLERIRPQIVELLLSRLVMRAHPVLRTNSAEGGWIVALVLQEQVRPPGRRGISEQPDEARTFGIGRSHAS